MPSHIVLCLLFIMCTLLIYVYRPNSHLYSPALLARPREDGTLAGEGGAPRTPADKRTPKGQKRWMHGCHKCQVDDVTGISPYVEASFFWKSATLGLKARENRGPLCM
jgi:hypothetical protein